ncbi:aldo/keto reductase [Anaeramoeba flamelloides]|uniref:Aldo/keto reductase n=1 Tax=Anaeramoeba flamelloides TaxID=1746091 RepID=A0ABQ8XFQ7_9EUKA|nr:aldo/keto reductase [Anaeramoeba flamelloides]
MSKTGYPKPWIPKFGLGTIDPPEKVIDAVAYAIEIGYRHIDCATIYGNEEAVGRGIKKGLEKANIERSELFITGKLWNTFHSPNLVEKTCKKTIEDLGVGYLDLYLMHYPLAFKEGEDMWPVENGKAILQKGVTIQQTYEAMVELKKKGLVKHLGVSNFTVGQIIDLQQADFVVECNQIELHPFLPQDKVIDWCRENGIVCTAYSPLGTPAWNLRPKNAPNIFQNEIMTNIAEKHSCSIVDVAIAWAQQRREDGLCVIPKSTTPKHITSNFEADKKVKLDEEDFKNIAKLSCGFRLVDPYNLWKIPLFD